MAYLHEKEGHTTAVKQEEATNKEYFQAYPISTMKKEGHTIAVKQEEATNREYFQAHPISTMKKEGHTIAVQQEATNTEYFQAYPISTMKHILCMLVPEGAKSLSIPDLVNDCNWLREKNEELVRESFMKRFGHLPQADLEMLQRDIHHIPKGTLTIRSLRQTIDESLKGQVDELNLQRNRLLNRQKLATLANTHAKVELFQDMMPIIDDISVKLGREATALAHDGTSTYAEPTKMGLLDIADTIKPFLGDPRGHLIMDCGSGVGTALWTLCQALNIKGVGVEYSLNRMFCGCTATYQLLEKWKNHNALQHNVVMVHGNLLALHKLPEGVTIAYQYDEVFPPELMNHMLSLYALSPPSLRFVISTKAYKNPSYARLFEEAGFYSLTPGIPVRKIGSGESSGFIIYRRQGMTKLELPTRLPLGAPRSLLDHLLMSNVESVLRYYKEVANKMKACMSVKRVRPWQL
jgi:hypothetical protein